MRDRDPTLDAAREIADDLRKANGHYGPWYLLSSIQLSDVGYNEQFFVPTTEQAGNVTFGISAPQRLYFVPSKKVFLSAEAVPIYSFVHGRGTSGVFNYRTRADAQFLLNHLYLDTYVARQDALQANSGELDRLINVRSTDLGVRGEVKYSSRTSMFYSAGFRDITHPDSELQPKDLPVELLDRREANYRATFLHHTFPLTSILGAVERSQYTFTTAKDKNAHRDYVAGGFEYATGRTTLRLEAGMGQLHFATAGKKDFRGALGSIGFSRRIGTRWTATGRLIRDLDFSIYGPNDYYIMDRAESLAEYSATRRLSIRFFVNEGRDIYQVPVGGLFRRDRISFDGVGWLYTVRKIRGGFDVGYYRRQSNIAELEENNGIRVTLHLSFTP